VQITCPPSAGNPAGVDISIRAGQQLLISQSGRSPGPAPQYQVLSRAAVEKVFQSRRGWPDAGGGEKLFGSELHEAVLREPSERYPKTSGESCKVGTQLDGSGCAMLVRVKCSMGPGPTDGPRPSPTQARTGSDGDWGNTLMAGLITTCWGMAGAMPMP